MSDQDTQNNNDAAVLEAAKTENLKAQAALLAEQRATEEVREAKRQNAEKEAYRAALASLGTVKLHDPALFVDLIKSSYAPRWDAETSSVVCYVNGEYVSVASAARELLRQKSFLADGRTVSKDLKTEPEVQKSRSEMTVAEKVAFINEFGGNAFEKLSNQPKTKSVPVDSLTFEQYASLDRADKVKILAERGPSFVERLPRGGGYQSGKLAGK